MLRVLLDREPELAKIGGWSNRSHDGPVRRMFPNGTSNCDADRVSRTPRRQLLRRFDAIQGHTPGLVEALLSAESQDFGTNLGAIDTEGLKDSFDTLSFTGKLRRLSDRLCKCASSRLADCTRS
jgi:hypothetical protein